MNWALWKKAVSDSWVHLLASCALLCGFAWVFVWFTSLLPSGAWGSILSWIPQFARPLLGMPVADLATVTGQISFLYVHVVTTLVCVGWAIGRGSESVSGEISRGTMDLILTLPVRRVSVLLVPAVVATLGAAIMALALWFGTWLGLLSFHLTEKAPLARFLPGAVNLFAMTFCLTGVTAFISSWNRDRWRTVSLAAGFFLVSFIIKILARLWEAGAWLEYLSFLSAFEPQRLILPQPGAEALGLWYNGVLLGLGVVAYGLGAVVLAYRDIPAAK